MLGGSPRRLPVGCIRSSSVGPSKGCAVHALPFHFVGCRGEEQEKSTPLPQVKTLLNAEICRRLCFEGLKESEILRYFKIKINNFYTIPKYKLNFICQNKRFFFCDAEALPVCSDFFPNSIKQKQINALPPARPSCPMFNTKETQFSFGVSSMYCIVFLFFISLFSSFRGRNHK